MPVQPCAGRSLGLLSRAPDLLCLPSKQESGSFLLPLSRCGLLQPGAGALLARAQLGLCCSLQPCKLLGFACSSLPSRPDLIAAAERGVLFSLVPLILDSQVLVCVHWSARLRENILRSTSLKRACFPQALCHAVSHRPARGSGAKSHRLALQVELSVAERCRHVSHTGAVVDAIAPASCGVVAQRCFIQLAAWRGLSGSPLPPGAPRAACRAAPVPDPIAQSGRARLGPVRRCAQL